jgi:Ca-activated chloride channel family protein
MMQNRITAVAVLGLLVMSASIVGAQAPAPALPENMVYVPVAVTGAKNAFINALKKENFQLKEDGKDQTIVSFSEGEPFDINIILAIGVLQRGRVDLNSSKIREAVEEFRKAGHPDNRYSVEELPFGSNGVFDAISRHVRGMSELKNPRKALVVVTDGFDSAGGDPGRALQEYAKGKDVPIYIFYAAGPGGPSDDILDVGRGRQIYLEAGAIYEDLTRFTGGKLFQAEADTQLRGNLAALAMEFKSQYVLGFASTNPVRNDKWRKLEVKIVPPAGQKDLKARVKDRYFVAK